MRLEPLVRVTGIAKHRATRRSVGWNPKEEHIMKLHIAQMLGLVAGTVFAVSAAPAAAAAHSEGGNASARLQQEFKKLDENGDGYMSLAEAQTAFETAFQAADRNGDGRLSLEEYAKYTKARAGKECATAERSKRMSDGPMEKSSPHRTQAPAPR
jgi:hypothetical protein